jgi:predicted ribosome-associated RNA-binding protein Tma20
MSEINDFVEQFATSIILDKNSIVRNRNRYYLLSKKLKKQIPKGYFYAGEYLGAIKGASFFPSFFLLSRIAETKANRVVVDKRTAWLFICGRDIFRQGILEGNNLKKGDYTLVLNEYNECLGFGKIVINLRGVPDAKKVAVKNILDLGDFLRRERHHPRRHPHSNLPRKGTHR